jgi:hypothetical protein
MSSPEQYAELKARIVRAAAQRWFAACEAPPRAGTLPITEDDIVALLNGPNEGKQRAIVPKRWLTGRRPGKGGAPASFKAGDKDRLPIGVSPQPGSTPCGARLPAVARTLAGRAGGILSAVQWRRTT